MKCKHHNLEFEINDEWLIESQMDNFVPNGSTYRVDEVQNRGQDIFEVSIIDIAPLGKRAKGKGVFCGNNNETAKDRVVRILNWFRKNHKIEPICVVKLNGNNKYKYKVVEGSHRFYCSIAVGFLMVPAIFGIDINDPYL